jgi:predicted RNase H-like nuclease (RuvC/YqgF family)
MMMRDKMQEVTLQEAAKILHCSTKTIRRRIHAGLLSARLVSGHKGPEYRISLQESDSVTKAQIPKAKIGQVSPNPLDPSNTPASLTHYEKLYREISAKYEQALMLIGRLQAELDKKVPQLEAEASSLKEKYDLLKLNHEEKQRKLREHEKALETKEYVIAELAKELDNVNLELKKRESPLYLFKRLFRIA